MSSQYSTRHGKLVSSLTLRPVPRAGVLQSDLLHTMKVCITPKTPRARRARSCFRVFLGPGQPGDTSVRQANRSEAEVLETKCTSRL